MKRTSLIIMIVTMCYSTYAQQHFKFKYTLSTYYNGKGRFFEIIPGGNTSKVWKGYIDPNRHANAGHDTMSVFTTETSDLYAPRTINSGYSLIGKIEVSEDTVTIKPWYETNTAVNRLIDENSSPIYLNADNDFILLITNWDYNLRGNPCLDIPFSFREVTATNLPLRISIKSGELQTDFLNANLTYLWIWGKTRLYKSKFVDARNRYWGIGPYLGLSTIEDGDKKALGLNYGANALVSLYNFNLVLALGAETGFDKKANNFNPYFGIGVGFKLVDLYDPSTSSSK